MCPSKKEEALQEFFGARRPTCWVTRERPKIDRIACPWAIRRFIDANAEIIYVPTQEVFDTAAREKAVAFDIPGAPISHEDELCSFDTLLARFGLNDDQALAKVARIVRGADTDHHEIAPEAAGLHAISLGLSQNFDDDHALLAQGMVVYDALYAWAKNGKVERHTWTPPA
ncbi:superoxide dismutase SodM-like protein ChrF [alpha proteobacterium U9-1i]|nr:superoxide dismutase SodM-like protein ChrF [alpha proteobacterium U9-1i]